MWSEIQPGGRQLLYGAIKHGLLALSLNVCELDHDQKLTDSCGSCVEAKDISHEVRSLISLSVALAVPSLRQAGS